MSSSLSLKLKEPLQPVQLQMQKRNTKFRPPAARYTEGWIFISNRETTIRLVDDCTHSKLLVLLCIPVSATRKGQSMTEFACAQSSDPEWTKTLSFAFSSIFTYSSLRIQRCQIWYLSGFSSLDLFVESLHAGWRAWACNDSTKRSRDENPRRSAAEL